MSGDLDIILEQLSNSVDVLFKQNEMLSNALVESTKILSDNINKVAMLERAIVDDRGKLLNIKYELFDKIGYSDDEIWFPQIRAIDDTIQDIIKNKKSISRFGDGEYSIIFGKNRQPFQGVEGNLGIRLKDVLHSEMNNLLIGVADNHGSLDKYNHNAAMGIRAYMIEDDNRKLLNDIIDRNRIYKDTYISRPYVIYADNNTDAPRKRFGALKRIWDDRDIIFVEGEKTRCGIGNDLFDNAKSVKRILAPAVNAYSAYDEIFNAALDVAKEDTLFYLALGPTATVLAHDLCQKGYQALDLGHLDLEYEWMKAGKGCRVATPGKYSNEMQGGHEVEDVLDETYTSQIVRRIGI